MAMCVERDTSLTLILANLSHLSIDRQPANANRSGRNARNTQFEKELMVLAHIEKCLVSKHKWLTICFLWHFIFYVMIQCRHWCRFSLNQNEHFSQENDDKLSKEMAFHCFVMSNDWNDMHKVTMSKSTKCHNSEMKLLLWLHFSKKNFPQIELTCTCFIWNEPILCRNLASFFFFA